MRRQILHFFLAGCIGFVVDAGGVQLLVSFADANPYLARLLSFVCAANATWLYNRSVTFAGRGSFALLGEWARWMLAMSAGFALNYVTYAALVFHFPTVRAWPVLGVAAGSALGAIANFLSAHHWVYGSPANGLKSRP